MKKIVMFALSVLLSLTLVANAAATAWEIIPSESNIGFTGTQNGAPVKGSFKTFTGDIQFDPKQLASSSVRIEVNMASLATPYSDLTDTLITSDWFNVSAFPKAIFTAKEFAQIGEHQFQAKGELSIRDKKVPVMVVFNLEPLANDKDRVVGMFTVKRTDFGVGAGEWSSTKEVKDDVDIDFVITASKK